MATNNPAEELRLLRAVISQMSEKLDNEKLARDIGAPTAAAAQKRWKRYREKLLGAAGSAPSPARGGAASTAAPAVRAPAAAARGRGGGVAARATAPVTPKNAKGGGGTGKGKMGSGSGGGKGKKRKREDSDTEEEVAEEVNGGDTTEEMEVGDEDDEFPPVAELKPETPPSRKMPGRQARSASKYKEDSDEDSVDEEVWEDARDEM